MIHLFVYIYLCITKISTEDKLQITWRLFRITFYWSHHSQQPINNYLEDIAVFRLNIHYIKSSNFLIDSVHWLEIISSYCLPYLKQNSFAQGCNTTPRHMFNSTLLLKIFDSPWIFSFWSISKVWISCPICSKKSSLSLNSLEVFLQKIQTEPD